MYFKISPDIYTYMLAGCVMVIKSHWSIYNQLQPADTWSVSELFHYWSMGLSPVKYQATTWSSANRCSVGLLLAHFNETPTKIIHENVFENVFRKNLSVLGNLSACVLQRYDIRKIFMDNDICIFLKLLYRPHLPAKQNKNKQSKKNPTSSKYIIIYHCYWSWI